VAHGFLAEGFDMQKRAEISSCGKYRYALSRIWDDEKRKVMFIGLNPSTADEEKDDMTIKRCLSYTRQWGYGGIVVANLFALRSTDPSALMRCADAVGPANDSWLRTLAEKAGLIVAIWGNLGSYLNRNLVVKSMFPNLMCLGTTAKGQPHHTRGLPDGLNPIPLTGIVKPSGRYQTRFGSYEFCSSTISSGQEISLI